MIVFLKSKSEIEGFKEAGKISGSILNVILGEIKPGVITKYLNEVALEECKKNNVTPTFLGYHGFPAAICVSVNKTLVHGIPNDYILQSQDIVSVDLGITLDGFIGDTAETVLVENENFEEVTSKEFKLIKDCRFALDFSIKKAFHGNSLSDVCGFIYNVSKCRGYGVPKSYGGHGIDRYKLHAPPFIPCHTEHLDNITLRAGMVLAIEPMLIIGKGTTKVLDDKWSVETDGLSAHCEHTILITESEPLILTRRLNE